MNFLPSRRTFLHLTLGAGAGWGLGRSLAAVPRPGLPFNLGIITDEISDDPEQALKFLSDYSLSHCELRLIEQKNIMNLSADELERTRKLIEGRRIRVSNIASPLFKYNLPEMPARQEKRDTFRANFTDQDTNALLRKSFELAKFFRTRQVRIFSYWRVEEAEKAYPLVRDRLAKAARLAANEGIVLALENEHDCNVGSGKELGRILRDVNSPHLRGTWDPGNAALLNEIPFPDGYEAVRGLFSHMHIKDARKDSQSGKWVWVPVGNGVIDYRGQLRALLRDGYQGTMSLETHYRRSDGNAMESTRESLEGLLKIIREVEPKKEG